MVITLDKHKKPLGVCTERRARILLTKKRACVHKYFPFTIIVKDVDVREVKADAEYSIKIDPGSKYTGIAVVRTSDNTVVLYMQIEHRGEQVVKNLLTRNQARRNRRSRETPYRRPKWGNKTLAKGKKPGYETSRPDGWLPPSVKSIGDNIIIWAEKLRRLMNITQCSFEAVRFDTQLLDNPDIEGVQYQQGELFGYEVKEYLMQKYGHTCQYCGGKSDDPVLEWEHKIPRSKGGSNSVKNATLACHRCNQEKDARTPQEWLSAIKSKKRKTKLDEARIANIQKILENKSPLGSNRYCAWVNACRRYIERALFKIFGTVECSSGGRTKYNRTKLGLPKDHHYDALCVGSVPEEGYNDATNGYWLSAKAMGRGSRFRGKINECGIIVVKIPKGSKRRLGFQNGDIVAADQPKGKYAGHHVGRVMTRSSGSFDIRRTDGELVTVSYKACRILQHDDGYQYCYRHALKTPIPLGN